MADIVDRLRRSHHEWVKGGHGALQKLANDAADEIEALRLAVDNRSNYIVRLERHYANQS